MTTWLRSQTVSPDWRRLPWQARYVGAERVLSELKRITVLATHRHARVEFRGPVYLGRGFQLLMPHGGSFIVGAGVEFRRDFVCEIQGDGRVEIGDGAIFTYGCVIQCSTSVEVGAGAMIGQHCQIVDGNHRFRDPNVPFLEQGYDFQPIRIGAQAAILSKCTIIADVGERAVVAAHSVVTKPIPPFSLAGGVPAKVLDRYGPDAHVPD